MYRCINFQQTRMATKAIAPGVTIFIPHKCPTVLVSGDLLACSDKLLKRIDWSIYNSEHWLIRKPKA